MYIYQKGKQWKLQEVFAVLEKWNFKTKPKPNKYQATSQT